MTKSGLIIRTIYIISNNYKIIKMRNKKKEQKNDNKKEIKWFIKNGTDKQVICTLSKNNNHISNLHLQLKRKEQKD